ncbi:hypothetical protein GCM10027275_50070 [Rhabdobacter roseus]|jgi:hypothetical protein|uniref:Uncharacterized protein n=1 Tax=Rhabdobacter roseus TaxID=1655419 RepID=A0A840TSZ4_9BACT|nr:hypothetical protein [Rhabdobacter roseus]MBB5287071.1 hypothetical protein [Rhabdobacter roseus]
MTTRIIVIFLGTFSFSLFVYLIYRIYNKFYSVTPKLVTVPLQPNRSALLAKQRKVVNERRNEIRGGSTAEKPSQAVPEEKGNPEPDPMDSGFGEDLGLAIAESQEKSASTLVKRRSRFADMKSAAEELKEIYNRNSKIE